MLQPQMRQQAEAQQTLERTDTLFNQLLHHFTIKGTTQSHDKCHANFQRAASSLTEQCKVVECAICRNLTHAVHILLALLKQTRLCCACTA